MKQYTFRPGYAPKNSPEVVGEALEDIKAHVNGYLKPEHVVDAARPKKHVLHDEFEWRDKIAGEAWRRQQARMLIKCVQVVFEDESGEDFKAPQFINISVPVTEQVKDNQAYVAVADILTDVDKRRMALENLKADIKRIETKYVAIRELHDYIKHLDNILGLITSELQTIEAS